MKLIDAIAENHGELTEWRQDIHAHPELGFEEERTEAAKKTVWATGCKSWYLDDRGIPFAWPFPFTRFRAEMEAPRLEDYESPGQAA